MPKTIVVGKCDIIKAVMTEPLLSGIWMDEAKDHLTLDNANQKNYRVCAVGAVLRDRLSKNKTVAGFNDQCWAIAVFAAAPVYNEWMARLFSFFEFQCRKHGTDSQKLKGKAATQVRYAVAKMVAEEFPEEVVIQIPSEF